MLAAGVATSAEITDAAATLRALSADPSVLFGLPRNVQAWTRRP
jgi:hypothetical protein